jgi:hypothetical protein
LTDWNIRHSAALALDQLHWKPKTPADRIHYQVAQGQKELLSKKWELTQQILLDDVLLGDERSIEYGVYAFMELGGDEGILKLIDILEKSGNSMMAQAYFDCGHPGLMDAARSWADADGYRLETECSNCP